MALDLVISSEVISSVAMAMDEQPFLFPQQEILDFLKANLDMNNLTLQVGHGLIYRLNTRRAKIEFPSYNRLCTSKIM